MAATQEIINWARAASVEEILREISVFETEQVFDTPCIYEIGSDYKQRTFVSAVVDKIYRNHGRVPGEDSNTFAEQFLRMNRKYTVGDLVHFADKCTQVYDIGFLNVAELFKWWREYLMMRGKEESRLIAKAQKVKAEVKEDDIVPPEEADIRWKALMVTWGTKENLRKEWETGTIPGTNIPNTAIDYIKFLIYQLSQRGWERKGGEWYRIGHERMEVIRDGWQRKVIDPLIASHNTHSAA